MLTHVTCDTLPVCQLARGGTTARVLLLPVASRGGDPAGRHRWMMVGPRVVGHGSTAWLPRLLFFLLLSPPLLHAEPFF